MCRDARLLILSSDLEILRALSWALTAAGNAVTVTTDWSGAIARLCSLPVSVMLYDVKELDRTEVSRLVALQRDHADLAVVVLASLASPELERAVEEGIIADYVMKPIHLTALERSLAALGVGRA